MTPEKAYASPLTNDAIRLSAEKALASLIFTNKIRYEQIDVVKIYEYFLDDIAPGFSYRILPDDQMDGHEAYTTFDPKVIFVAQAVFRAAAQGNPRARFSLAHELGHALLHYEHGKLYTAHRTQSPYRERVKNTEKYRDPEWQANVFASYFLMPNHIVNSAQTEVELASIAGVSQQSASIRWRTKTSKRQRS